MNGFTPHMFAEMAKAFTEFENDNNALCAIVIQVETTSGMDLNR